MPEELEPVDIDDCCLYLWNYYIELSGGRQVNGMAACPLTWGCIAQWCGLLKVRLDPWEVRAIRAIDREFIEHCNKEKPK